MAAARRKPLVAIAACLVATAAGAADLGTLFTTPEERARLDRIRRGDPPVGEVSPTGNRSGVPVMTGYVKRSDGRNTVWIDGSPVAVGKESAALLDPRAVDRPAPAEGPMHVEGKPAR
ncbi:MAG TPA: hypothetical protein VKR38_06775 [Usitatibacter sp.]|nr:hypothetical protein [Usitatibacter sp.]